MTNNDCVCSAEKEKEEKKENYRFEHRCTLFGITRIFTVALGVAMVVRRL
jgi:hypothetical protein